MAYDPSRASPVVKEPKAQSDITLDALLDEFEVSDPAVRDRVLRLAGVESSGNLSATGPRVNGGMHNGTRARGALQIMPATAKAYPQYDLNDPADATRAGLHYFLDNLNQFGGDLDAATIAHHAGPGTAKKWLREGRAGTVDRATGLSTDDYLLKVTGGKRAKPADKWWESDPVAPAEAAGNWWESDPVEPAEEPGLLERGWSALKDTFSAPSGEPVDVRPHPGEKAPAATKLDSVMADYQGEQSARQTPANAQTRAFVQQQYDAHPEKREAMLSRPDWLGDIARQIDAEYQAMNPAESLKPFDQRREAKLARNRAQGMDPATAEMTTASQMIGGEAPVGSIKASDFDFDLKQRYEGANPALRGAVKGYEGYRQGVLGFLQAGADLVGADFASGQFRQGAREAAGQAAAIGEGEAGARLFEGAVASLTQQLPLLIGGSIAGGQALILSGMAAQAFGQEYSEGRQAGLNGQDAATRASLFAAFEVIGEKFGLGNQLAALRMAYKGVPTKQLVAELGAALAKEIPGEVLTTTGQFLTDKAPQIGLNPEAGMAQYLSQVADTIGQTIIQGGLMMGGAAAVSRGARAMQRPEPDLTAGLQFDPRVNDALARQALDPSNAQETANVAPPLDAASYQGPGAVPAGGAGNTPSGPVDLGRVDQPAGAPARSGEPGVSVGEAERQQVAGVVEQKIAEKEAEAAATGDPIELLVTRAEGAALRRAVTPQPANGIDIDQDALLADVEAMFTDGGNLMVQGDNAREAVKRIDPKALASALPRGDGALLVPKRFAGPVMDALQGAKQRVSVAFGGDGMMQAPDVAQFRATVPTQEEVQDVPKAEQVAPQATEARGQEGEAAADGRVTRDRPMNDGATVTDAQGNQYRVHYQRNDLVVAHPIVNGKPQVSADTTIRFWTNQDVAPSGENDRTDPIYPVAQPTEARSSIEGEPASWVIRNKETGEAVMETFDRAKVDALNTKKYEAVPILQHLQEVNRGIKETQAPTAPEQSRPAPSPRSESAQPDMPPDAIAPSPAPAQTQAANKPKRQPPARKPDPVTVDRAQRNAEDLRAMAQDAGWAEEGGKLIRDAEGKASRTKWIPRAEWFLSGMEARPDVLAQHIDAAARGEWIPVKSARTIEGMVEWLDAQRGQATLDEDASMYDFEASFGDVLDVPDAREVAEFFDDTFGDFAEQSEADAMRAMGFTEEEIANAGGQTQAGAGSAEAADARGTAEPGERAGEAGAAQEEAGQGQREGLNAQQRDEQRRAQAVQALAPLGWDVSEGRAEKTFEGTKLGSGYNNITKSTLTASVSGGFINLYSGWDRIGSVAITANMAPDAVAAELNKKAEAWAQDRKAAKEERAKPMLQSNGKPFPSEKLAAESARQRKLDMVPVEVDGGWGLVADLPEQGVTYREGKGRAKGQWIATLEDGTEGNAKPSKNEALEDARRLARTKQANNQRKNEQAEALERAISKASLGGNLTDADLVMAGLTPNREGNMDWLVFSQVVRQELGLTPRQLRPMVRGAIFEIQTPTGGQVERVDPRKALLEIAKSRASAEPLALDTYTNADIAKREAEQAAQAEAEARAEREAAAKQRQAEERAEVRRRSEAAADTFELGMDPMENLTGQGGLFGQADSAPQPARPAAPAASANTIFTEDAAEKARALLRRKLGQLNSGVDPEMLQAGITLAGYHIEKGARSFAAYARAMLGDLGEAVRPYLKSWYVAIAFDPRARGFDGMDNIADVQAADENADFIGMAQQEQGNGTDERGDSGVEPDRRNAEAQDGVGEEGIRAEPERDAAGRGQGVQGARADGGARRSGELSGREAAPARERGDLTVYTGATDVPGSAARSDLDRRSADPGLDGAPVEPDAAKAVEDAARGGSRLAATKAAQAEADAAPHGNSLEDIRAALPALLPGQQEDVFKAEQRFAKPDGYGMLFTNGTGTGKTWTGLGIVKRFALAGKTNTLIVAPNDKIIEDWQKSGRVLGLNIARLQDTNDAGAGIVITTYANFGDNAALASREWDLVVSDESHYLMQDKDGTPTSYLRSLRAITLHPDGVYRRHEMLNGDEIAERNRLAADAKMLRTSDDERQWAQAEKVQDRADALSRKLEEKFRALEADIKARQGAARTRVVFLSATPFAYEKTIDWANGYLFDYNEGQSSEAGSFRGYNDGGSNRDRFFMQHLGYRMRYNKLAQPDAKVDSGLMQRQFNGWLKKKGSLSGRMLDVPFDYDRRFILVDSAIGTRIDAALTWLREEGGRIAEAGGDRRGVDALKFAIDEKFDYLSRRYLLEAIKAAEVIPHVREHLALGRKVVVFHDYKKGGGFNPFVQRRLNEGGDDADAAAARKAYNAALDAFNQQFADLIGSDIAKMPNPIEAFQRAFPDVLLFNGNVPKQQRRANVAKFQDDASGPQVILVQSAAGKEGISLHDTTGKYQRVLFNLGQPTQPTTAIQQEGRIYRTGQQSDAIIRYLNTGTNWEKWAFASTIAQRASAAENLGAGEQARALKDAFIQGFEESDAYRAGMEGEGKGGKERDRLANEAISEYDRAKAYYFGQQKKTSKTKAQEGADYFATPEPVGLKMVEWADIRPGERVLEPSAGHGAIARWMPENAERTAIEPSSTLLPRLAMVFDGKIQDTTFEALNVVNKFDAIVMNPPFGSGGKTAIEHVAKAATHLREKGRIVALIPTGPAADKRFEKWFYETEERPAKPLFEHPTLGPIYRGDTLTISGFGASTTIVVDKVDGRADGPRYVRDANTGPAGAINATAISNVEATGQRMQAVRPAEGLHLIADIKMPGVTFERAGTRVATRIVVIEKQSDPAVAQNLAERQRDYTGVEDIGELFDRLEDLTLPKRTGVVEADAAPVDRAEQAGDKTKPKAASPGAVGTVERQGLPIVEHTTAKGKVIRGVIRTDLSKEQAQKIDPYTWKKDGGFFIREQYLKPEGDAPAMSRVSGQETAPAMTRGALVQSISSRFPSLTRAVESALRRGDEGKPGGVVVVERAEDLAGTFASKTGRTLEEAQKSLQASVRAWHGSPYRFDRFDLGNVGMGEGAQAYGWGLYFADSKEVAEHYRSMGGYSLTPANDAAKARFSEVTNFAWGAVQGVSDALENNKGDIGKTVARLRNFYADTNRPEMREAYLTIADMLESGDLTAKREGATYKVKIAPAEDTFLLWDKPLSEQPKKVRDALRKLDWMDESVFEQYTGQQMYEGQVRDATMFEGRDKVNARREASGALLKAGVRGIKYLDGQSRDSKGDSFNYVIFDDADVEIVDVHLSQNGDIQGFFDSRSGLTFLVAPNLTERTAPAVLLHEATHGKQRAEIDRKAMDLIETRQARSKPLRDFLFRVEQRMEAAGESGNATEAAAYIVEEAVVAGRQAGFSAVDGKLMNWIDLKFGRRVSDIVRDFVAMVRAWAMRAGVEMNPTVDDLVAIAKLNVRDMARGDVTGGSADGKMQSMSERSRVASEQAPDPAGDGTTGGATPNHRAAAEQMLALIEQDDGFADFAVRVIPDESPAPVVGEMLSPSRVWDDGNATDEMLPGTSAVGIESNSLDGVVRAIQRAGAHGRRGPNGYYPGSTVVLVKGEKAGAGDDVGEVLLRDAEVVGIWKKPNDGPSELIPNEPTAPSAAGAIFSRASQTESKAFRDWFGDSKVVDENGQPLVVYHGGAAGIERFGHTGSNDPLAGGFYFTDDPAVAEQYADAEYERRGMYGEMYRAYISLQNPLVHDQSSGFVRNDSLIEKARNEGHDGVVILNSYDRIRSRRDDPPATVYVAFRPEQIKSATGNNGNFDPTDSRINFSRAGQATMGTPAAAAQPAQAAPRAAQAQATPPDETRFQAFQRKAQDKLNRFTVIKEWLAAQGVTLSEQADVYKAEERMHSRFANKAEDFREKTVKPLVEKIQRAGYSMDDVAQYLHAQHAEERNIQVASINKQMPDGGSGMKTADANAILAAAPAELKRLANEFRAITERTKQILLDSGIISQDMADAWDAAYQHYVPLKGGPEQGGKGAGKGLKANYKGKRALGHLMREEGEWIVENILADHERAIMLAEKNRVGQSLLKMAIEVGRDDLLTVGKPEKRGVLKNNTAYEVLFKGKVIGAFQSLEAARTFRATAPAAMKGASPSEFGIRKVSDPTVAYMASPMLADNEVNVYVKGQAIRVQINDELLARAYGNMGTEALGAILRVGAAINGYFSKIYTGYNPEFILTNIVRDFTTGVANVTGEEGAMMALRAAKDYPASFADLFRYATTGNASQWIRMYREDGGNTGAAYLSDLERLGDEISTEYAAYKGVLANLKAGDVKSAARAAGRKAFDKTLVWVERINQAGENAMRLSIYKAMIESGKSRAEAASLAKNATVNFNRNGEVGRQMNALWLFYNAGVQGTAAIAHANLKGRHKWQARAVSAGILGLGYTMAVALGAGDDEDDYDKLSDYTKARNVVIKTGDGWLKIPVPYGYGFFWNMGRAIADAERKGEWGKAPWHVASSFIEEFTPFGAAFAGDDLALEQITLGALPTLAQIPSSVGMNRTTMGGPMYPESAFDKYQPDNEKMWRATKGTIPDMIAQALDQGGIEVSPETIKYLTRTFTGGAGQFVTSIGDAAWLTANGASLEVKEQPFVRKFYTETDVREARSAYHAAVAEAEKAVREGKSLLKMGDHAAYGAYRVENQEFYALDRMAKALAAAIKARRNYADAIRADKSLSVKEKRDKLKAAEAQEQVIYDRYLEVFKSRTRR